jgi:hypothetical protein
MGGSRGVISVRGDVKRAYDYDKESSEIASSKTSKMSIQLEDTLSKQIPFSMEEPSKGAHIGNTLDTK